ncbi:MAG: hypothetical protein M0T74_13635 [Desulfitobacterium hafniense]|nr:hypothetical protein [Desulfitobacterium hafniense]
MHKGTALSEQVTKLREKYAVETGWKQDVSNWPLRYRNLGWCQALAQAAAIDALMPPESMLFEIGAGADLASSSFAVWLSI